MKQLFEENLFSTDIEFEYTKKTDVNYRRSQGQFFTPFEVAEFMVEWILGGRNSRNLKILDPAAGFGVFERAILKVFGDNSKNFSFDLWEIDHNICSQLKEIVHDSNLDAQLHNGDFLSKCSWDERYDGIIANPPYYKHHFISDKQKVFENICLKSNFMFSVQTNIYCWFLIKSLQLLNDGGRLAFIVPSEFLNSNYGEKVKSYLMSSGLICHLININFTENVFDSALTTSVIILAEKSNAKNSVIRFYSVNDITKMQGLLNFLNSQKHKTFNVAKLNPQLKWRNYFNGYSNHLEASENVVPFLTFGRFSRGIATGSNEYFTLSKLEVDRYQLPFECLLPCVTKSMFVKERRFGNSDFQDLVDDDKKTYLFDGTKSSIRHVKEYIRLGVEQEVDQKYLTKCRDPWYSLEKRDRSQIWVSVFGRNGLKFIWNDSNCLNLTCFHAFYPTEIGEGFLDIIYLYLSTPIAHYFLEKEKREYGNGLEKFEPNDINKTMIPDFRKLNKNQIAELKELHRILLTGKDDKTVINKADKIIRELIG